MRTNGVHSLVQGAGVMYTLIFGSGMHWKWDSDKIDKQNHLFNIYHKLIFNFSQMNVYIGN